MRKISDKLLRTMLDLIHRSAKCTVRSNNLLVEKFTLQRELGDSGHRVVVGVFLIRHKYGHTLKG